MPLKGWKPDDVSCVAKTRSMTISRPRPHTKQPKNLTFVQGILDGLVDAEDLLALEGGGSGDRDLVATNGLENKNTSS